MERIPRRGVLCPLLSVAAPVWAQKIVWNFGAAAVGARNGNLPGLRPSSSPSLATATQYHLNVDGATLAVCAYSSRVSAPLRANLAGVSAALREHRWEPPSQSFV